MVDLQRIQSKIYEIRGHKVMINRDLAELYQVTTGNLNKSVQRNIKRFPSDFMFQLTKEEFDQMQEMFNSYVRGGVEELYERLIVRTPDADDDYYDEKTANIMELFERFACQN